MKKFLWITIVGSVLAVLAAPQPVASLRTPAQAECDCSKLKVLQIELRNAIRLQQAFRNKIAELRTMNGDSAQGALKVFAEGEARRGLEPIPDYKGPSEFDYVPWGQNQRTFNFPTEKLCGISDSARVKLDQAVAASACDGIGNALRAHENIHASTCRSVGYRAYLAMHGADRAQEEVEAYGAQIKVLREIIDRLRCGYRATGQTADLVYSGVICSLEKSFTVYGSIINYKFEFVPSSATAGTVTITAAGMMVTAEGGGKYTIEGADTDKPRIALAGTVIGQSAVGSRTGSGTIYIDLVPLDKDECK